MTGVDVVVALWLVGLGMLLVVWTLAGLPGVFVAVVVLACSWAPQAQAACRWSVPNDDLAARPDKVRHAKLEAQVGVAVALADAALDVVDLTPTQQWGVAVLPGLLHEIDTACFDKRPGAGFSWQDMVYNALGAAAGVALGNGVLVLLTPRSVAIYKEW